MRKLIVPFIAVFAAAFMTVAMHPFTWAWLEGLPIACGR
jgi:hypothetical protein